MVELPGRLIVAVLIVSSTSGSPGVGIQARSPADLVSRAHDPVADHVPGPDDPIIHHALKSGNVTEDASSRSVVPLAAARSAM